VKRLLLVLLVIVSFPVMANAQTYYRPYYQERPLATNSEIPTYPYFLENRTGDPLTVYVYVNKVRWEFVISPDNEVPATMLPLGAKVRVEAFADSGKNKGKNKQRVYSAFYHRQEKNLKVSRGWVFYK